MAKTRAQLDAEIEAYLTSEFNAPRVQGATVATSTNRFALGEIVIRNGGATVFPNRIEATERTHLKRCIAAGLLTVADRAHLALTPAGVKTALRELRDAERRALTPSRNDPDPSDPRPAVQAEVARRRRKIEALATAIDRLSSEISS